MDKCTMFPIELSKIYSGKKDRLVPPRPVGAALRIIRVEGAQPSSKGLLSAALYVGSDSFERVYFRNFLRVVQKGEPIEGWVYRIYVPCDFPQYYIDQLVAAGAEVYVVNRETYGSSGMFFRMLPACDSKPYVTIDTDSLPKSVFPCIEQWLRTDLPFFIHPSPLYFHSIRGQLYGSRNCALPDIFDQVSQVIDSHCSYEDDERFLDFYVWPRAAGQVFQSHKLWSFFTADAMLFWQMMTLIFLSGHVYQPFAYLGLLPVTYLLCACYKLF